jgi:ATP-dependent HslUV protease ATP-binding subunit HslU
MERVLEEISFLAPDLARAAKDADQAELLKKTIADETTTPLPYLERETQTGIEKVFLVNADYVRQMVAAIVKDQDLSRYIL